MKAASKDLGADVLRRGKACESVTRMHTIGGVLRGTQAAGDPPQEYPMKAMANHCYRVYAAADTQITSLVLLIKDSSGDNAGEEPDAVLPNDGAVCFTENDEARIVLTVGAGTGSYALQLWGD